MYNVLLCFFFFVSVYEDALWRLDSFAKSSTSPLQIAKEKSFDAESLEVKTAVSFS